MQANTSISAPTSQGPPSGRGEAPRGLSPINKVDRGGPAAAPKPERNVYTRTERANQQRVNHFERTRERPKRLRAHAAARGRTPPGRRYAATVASGDTVLVIDSAKARVHRAQRRVYTWAKVIPSSIVVTKRKKDTVEVPRLVMLTLTYANANDWHANDIREYMLKLRGELKSKLLAYAWVMEMQERGAPHYHVLLYVRRGTYVPTPDKTQMWGKGSSRIETAQTPFYVAKYIGKEYQKEMLPAGARMFAVWINKKIVDSTAYRELKMSSLPGWFRTALEECIELGEVIETGCWKRAPGGGWCHKETGQVWRSPWRLVHIETIYGRIITWAEQ